MNTFKTKILSIVAGFALCALALPAQAQAHDRDNHRDGGRRGGFSFDISVIFGGGGGRRPAPRCEPPICVPPPVVIVPCPPVHAPIDVTVYEPTCIKVPYTYYEDVRVEVPVYDRVWCRGRWEQRQVGTRCEWRSVPRTGYRAEMRNMPHTYRAYWDDCKGSYVYTDSCGVQRTVCR